MPAKKSRLPARKGESAIPTSSVSDEIAPRVDETTFGPRLSAHSREGQQTARAHLHRPPQSFDSRRTFTGDLSLYPARLIGS